MIRIDRQRLAEALDRLVEFLFIYIKVPKKIMKVGKFRVERNSMQDCFPRAFIPATFEKRTAQIAGRELEAGLDGQCLAEVFYRVIEIATLLRDGSQKVKSISHFRIQPRSLQKVALGIVKPLLLA
jgi:hypothetical protein